MELYTAEQAAEYLNTTERFVRRLIADRRIPFHKVGRYIRISHADLAGFVHAGRVDGLRSVTGDPAGRP